jgi:cytochrome c oxidase accessory protein FixG
MSTVTGPAEVKGSYQKIRDLLQPVLIIIFLAAPWIHFRGEPLILLDFLHRHFVFFGSTFYSHETPLLFFFVILLILAIFTVTALFGRLWCGWTCPHTVFLGAVFNRIERWILGTYSQRMLFYKGEDSVLKKFKILFLYFVFLAVCWIMSHSFVAYFVGASTITQYIVEGPSSNMTAFSICIALSLVLFFHFTFFREKLCMYICPYGRFQNALIDGNSLVVNYDNVRGEPRGKINLKNNDKGDCVDCNRCVNVCPAKIDIRNGFQFECISCGQCVDACNAVMKKINKPEGLIRYETGDQKPIAFTRFRVILYTGLMVLFAIGLGWSLAMRSGLDFNLSRSHERPFGSRVDGISKILQNQIFLHVKNQTQKPVNVTLSLGGVNLAQGFQLLTPAAHLQLEAGQDLKTTAFIEIEDSKFNGNQNEVNIILQSDNETIQRNLKFIRQEQ